MYGGAGLPGQGLNEVSWKFHEVLPEVENPAVSGLAGEGLTDIAPG